MFSSWRADRRVAFDTAPGGRGVDELEIEMRIVPDQDRLVACVAFNRFAYRFENFRQRLLFVDRQAERMMDVDAVDFHGFRVELGQRADSDTKCNTCNLLVQRMIFDLAPKTVADSPGFESLPASSRLEPPSIASL